MEADRGEDPLGRLEQPLPRGRAARREGAAVRTGLDVGHRDELQQLGLRDLVERVPGQRVDEPHLARHLVARQPLAAVRDQLLLGRLAGEHDECEAGLTPALVRNADDGGLRDGRMLVEDVLDLGGIDVLAAGDDHVLRPAHDPVVALLVAGGHVAGQQPPVGERGLGRLEIAPVAGEDVRAPDDELALGDALEQLSGLGIAQRDVDVWIRLAGEPALAGGVLGRQAEHVRRRLGQPVALNDLDAALLPGLEQRLGHRRTADDGAAEAREVGGGEGWILRHEEVVRGHAHHRRHALLRDQRERRGGVEVRLEHDARSLPPGEQRLHVPAAAVELRQHGEHDVVVRDPGHPVEGEVRPEAVRVREQRALRPARRPRRVDEQQPVVVRRAPAEPCNSLLQGLRAARLARGGTPPSSACSSEASSTAGSASSSWYASSGAARRQLSGIRIRPAFAHAKKTTTCSGLEPVSVATRSPGRRPASRKPAARRSERSSSSR